MMIVVLFLSLSLFSVILVTQSATNVPSMAPSPSPTQAPVLPLPKSLWNPETDPLPPLQPKEYGFVSSDYQFYYVTATGLVIFNLTAPGYSYYSYSNQSAISVAGGFQIIGNTATPIGLVNYINYYNPDYPGASSRSLFGTRQCDYNSVEGGGGYQGYDYWRNTLLADYYYGIPIYFQYTNISGYGVCLEYAAAPNINVTYNLYFQNSTGYLIYYIAQGHEH
jgi:hypothetical protein